MLHLILWATGNRKSFLSRRVTSSEWCFRKINLVWLGEVESTVTQPIRQHQSALGKDATQWKCDGFSMLLLQAKVPHWGQTLRLTGVSNTRSVCVWSRWESWKHFLGAESCSRHLRGVIWGYENVTYVTHKGATTVPWSETVFWCS